MEKCHASPYGGHLQETRQHRKFSNQDFISLLYSKTVFNGYNIVMLVKEWAT